MILTQRGGVIKEDGPSIIVPRAKSIHTTSYGFVLTLIKRCDLWGFFST